MTTSGAETKEPWTIQKILQWTTTHFTSKKISSARLDAELLLSKVLKCRRLDLYLKFDQPLRDSELKEFKELVKRRSGLEPVAYILGEQEFYSRPFSVGPGVLIPRPETEHIIDEAIQWCREKNLTENPLEILDIGSGSGCIGVTLALELKASRVTSVDISQKGVDFTRGNAAALNATERLNVVHKNFDEYFEELMTNEGAGRFDIIVSNPPYISLAEAKTLQTDVVKYEPAEALFGGQEGHEMIERWIPKMTKLLKPDGLLLCEIGHDQGGVVKKISEANALQSVVLKDYSGHQRVLKAQKEGTLVHG